MRTTNVIIALIFALAGCAGGEEGEGFETDSVSSPSGAYSTEELDTMVALAVVPLYVPGDVDSDGDVDLSDANEVQAFATSGTSHADCLAAADAVGPKGYVDQRDANWVSTLVGQSDLHLYFSSHMPCGRSAVDVASRHEVDVSTRATFVYLMGANPAGASVSVLGTGATVTQIDPRIYSVVVQSSVPVGGSVTVEIIRHGRSYRLPIAVVSGPVIEVFAEETTDGGTDAGVDGGGDAGTAGGDAGTGGGDAVDAGTDAGDAGDAETDGGDAGTDGGTDSGSDGGTDGGTDGGSDGGTDGGTDAGTDAGCPHTGCEALLINLFLEPYWKGFEGLDTALEAAGCNVEKYEAQAAFRSKPKRLCKKDGTGCSMTPAEEVDLKKKWGDDTKAEKKKLEDAIKAHKTAVEKKVKTAIQHVSAHGSVAYTGASCGRWGQGADVKNPLRMKRDEFWSRMYASVNPRNACDWIGSDFSCSSGLSVEAGKSLNNTGAAVCPATAMGHEGHDHHAAWDSDTFVAAAGTNGFCGDSVKKFKAHNKNLKGAATTGVDTSKYTSSYSDPGKGN